MPGSGTNGFRPGTVRDTRCTGLGNLRHGIDQDAGKKLQRLLKDSKLKIQAAIQGDQLRVSGKNKDDLQAVMQLLKGTDLGIDMQFTNRR